MLVIVGRVEREHRQLGSPAAEEPDGLDRLGIGIRHAVVHFVAVRDAILQRLDHFQSPANARARRGVTSLEHYFPVTHAEQEQYTVEPHGGDGLTGTLAH